MASTAAERDTLADICYERCLSELPGIGLKRFAGLVVAAASARAALDVSYEIEEHIKRKEEGLRLCRFILQRPVKDLFSALSSASNYDSYLVLLERTAKGVGAAGRWASDYKVEYLLPEVLCNNSSGYVLLRVQAHGSGSWRMLSARVCVADGSWRRVSVDAAELLDNFEEVAPPGLEILGEALKAHKAFADPLMAGDAVEMFAYAFSAASRYHRQFAGLVELVSLVASVYRAALPELVRARRIKIRHLGLPFAEEEAERARMAALAAYRAAVEAISRGDTRPAAELLENKRITKGTSAVDALYTFLKWKNTREHIFWARRRLSAVFTRAAMLRAAAEVLASLADDI